MSELNDLNAIARLGAIATELTGVQLNERHREMIRSRLQKRVHELKLASLDDYLRYFNENRATESGVLIGLLTTHHTFFFREYSHFEYLGRELLPALKPLLLARPDRTLRVWSAACSRGQEVYSLAMFLEYHLPRLDPSFRYRILGTDVDPASVAVARNGVYRREELKSAPISLVGDHWTRGKGEIVDYVKAKKSLRDHCEFAVGNLLAPEARSTPAEFDVIFCRNVFIYFNPVQIRAISETLLASLHPAGHLFVGISESLSQLNLPIRAHGPSVYTKKTATDAKPAPKTEARGAPEKRREPETKRPIRVLCVDDSPIILTLLKKILVPDAGFEIVGTAANGKEAAVQVAALKPDILSLDIHMPEMTGIEYLEKHFGPKHPPVVMLTSVSREDQSLAGKALSLGASDYIEKPALATLAERREEICWKLRCAFEAGRANAVAPLSLDRAFQKTREITRVEDCRKIVVFSLSDRRRVISTLRAAVESERVPTILAIAGISEISDTVAAGLSTELGRKVSVWRAWSTTLKPGEVSLVDARELSAGADASGELRTSIEVYGSASKADRVRLDKWQGSQIIVEDLGSGRGAPALDGLADDVVPATTFDYLSSQFFAKTGVTPKKVA